MRPAAISEEVWARMVGEYFQIYAPTRVKYVGQTMNVDVRDLTDAFKSFEFTFRRQYLRLLGYPFAGPESMVDDALDAKRRAAFLDSFDDFRDRALSTLRRIERVAERRALIERM
jgi:hypothetical protein